MTKVQITQRAFFDVMILLKLVEPNSLTGHDKTAYDRLSGEVTEKYNKMYDRMRYSEMLKTDNEHDRKAALDRYHKKKGKGMF